MSRADAQGRTAIIVIGGSRLLPAVVADLPSDAVVIAADSGLDHALAAGLQPELLVGDLDSVSPDGLQWAREHDVTIEQYPADKDMTDTQLALQAAASADVDAILLLAGDGDRLDHSLSAITALGHSSLAWCDHIEARWGRAWIGVVRGPSSSSFEVAPGTTFSLLALHGECTGVVLRGAKWPLATVTVEAGSSMGISNIAESTVFVSVRSGVVTVIFPNYFGGSL